MTETPILDERAVSEIEARKVVDHHLENGAYIGCYILLSTSERDVLCATVKHLRAELNTTKGHWADTSEDLASALLKQDELQSQLEQLRAENERLNAIVSAYENQDEEALDEAENL